MGLALATRLVTLNPGSNVLFVCVEACTLSFRDDRMQKADTIATVLFGNGAKYTWPDTLSIMGWDVDDKGFGVVFDRSIPEFARRYLGEAVSASLETLGLDQIELSRMICHPGGAKVIETALHLEHRILHHERAVLRDFGNMSAPTALFVLERALASASTGTMPMIALGPGFSASILPIRFS
ncbi:MAG: hypothetical protein MO846_11735 [Candidatus Devosia symbiotica]|nr:hypothetical protein [Candidatus Devosia symbiotica]